MEYPSTRAGAKAVGATHYFTGIPCKRGHTVPRETKGNCTECRKEDWQRDNDRRKLKPKTDAAKAAGRRYYLRNMELVKARAMARPAEKQRQYKAKYKKANPELYKVLVNCRRRRLKDASPPWLNKEEKQMIRKIYALALSTTELTGIRHEVDHVIPIVSDLVCGLHVPWNLKVITKTENLSKSNDF